ncbi:hypothetical protein B0H11DRAFT_2274118 [Mycena galericulata]|nr:hypothetical protein B0H11DRAFT_2274118 [Mycena galericulata]
MFRAECLVPLPQEARSQYSDPSTTSAVIGCGVGPDFPGLVAFKNAGTRPRKTAVLSKDRGSPGLYSTACDSITRPLTRERSRLFLRVRLSCRESLRRASNVFVPSASYCSLRKRDHSIPIQVPHRRSLAAV